SSWTSSPSSTRRSSCSARSPPSPSLARVNPRTRMAVAALQVQVARKLALVVTWEQAAWPQPVVLHLEVPALVEHPIHRAAPWARVATARAVTVAAELATAAVEQVQRPAAATALVVTTAAAAARVVAPLPSPARHGRCWTMTPAPKTAT